MFAMKGNTMSHTNNAFANTSNRSFEVHYREYLKHKDEPKEESHYDGASAELGADLLRVSYFQKRRLRRTARRLRHAQEAVDYPKLVRLTPHRE